MDAKLKSYIEPNGDRYCGPHIENAIIRPSKILLVGSDGLCRAGLRNIFEGSPFNVIGEGSDIATIDPGTVLNPEIAVMEISTDAPAVQRAVERLKEIYPDTLVVILSEKVCMATLAACLSAGVNGFLTRDISSEALLESLQLVVLGETVLPTGLATLLQHDDADWNPTRVNGSKAADLSDREIETVQGLLRGESNKLIARRLNITEGTIKVHVKSVLRKIKVSNRTQAAIWAHSHGISPGSLTLPFTHKRKARFDNGEQFPGN